MKKEPKKWQRWLPWVITAIMTLWIVSNLREDKETTAYNVEAFSRLPVLLNGRIQPIDSVARNALLMLRGKSTVLLVDKPQELMGFFEKAKAKKLTPAEWFLEATTRPDTADTRYVFRIDNQEVLGLLKLPIERKYFTFAELEEGWSEVEKQANRIQEVEKIDPAAQTPFEKEIVKLRSALVRLVPCSARPRDAHVKATSPPAFVMRCMLTKVSAQYGLCSNDSPEIVRSKVPSGNVSSWPEPMRSTPGPSARSTPV